MNPLLFLVQMQPWKVPNGIGIFLAIPCPENYFSPLNSAIKVNSSFLVKGTQRVEDLLEERKGEERHC